MTGLPIPDDWLNDEWECVQIQWPKSTKWLGILAGLLSTMHRGRTWDEQTGIITSIQEIGIEIYDRNIPFNLCSSIPGTDGDRDDGDISVCTIPSSAIVDFEEIFTVSLCGYNPKAFKMANGVLYVRDFCGEWVAIGAISEQPIVDDYTPPEITGGGYSACGKATAIMDMVHGVIVSVLDEVGNFSWQWWGHVKADNPGVGMDAKWIILACEGAVNQAASDAVLGDLYDPDALDASTWQSVKSQLAAELSDTMPEPMDGNTIRATLQNLFASEWGTDLLTNAIFVDALRGINRESFEAAAATGANYEDGDCGAPLPSIDDQISTWPVLYDWVVDWKFTEGTPYGTGYRNDNGVSGVTAAGLTMTTNTTGSETLGVHRTVITNTGYVENFYVEWYMGLAFVTADWGINGTMVGLSEMKYDVQDDGANHYHLLYEDVHRAISAIGSSDFGLWSFQGDYDDTKSPKFPVITRIVIAGSGAHPFA